MEHPSEVLGYYPDGIAIYKVAPGTIATCAFVMCTDCQTLIRTHGGPIPGARCPECFAKWRK